VPAARCKTVWPRYGRLWPADVSGDGFDVCFCGQSGLDLLRLSSGNLNTLQLFKLGDTVADVADKLRRRRLCRVDSGGAEIIATP
jgi:hypothetical protein